MTAGAIRIRKARQNNLDGVDVDLPRNRLIAITGLSGSGKSSLAFDTLFREGQRRFLETLSAYARQFLGKLEKPDVESIEGLSPAIAVDQKAAGKSQRSTVGTMTEVYDHLRVLFARAGTAHCPDCHLPLQSMTPEGIVQRVMTVAENKKTLLLAPVIRDRKGAHRQVFADLQRKGFVRARIDGEVMRLEDAPELERYKRHSIEVVLDRMKPKADEPGRLREAVEGAIEIGGGDVIAEVEGEDHSFSTLRSCPGCGAEVPPLEPRLFSFNSPHGACEECQGLGELQRPTERRVLRDPKLSIREGVLSVTRAKGDGLSYPKVTFEFLDQIALAHDFDLETPWKDLSAKAKHIVLQGAGEERYEDTATWNGARFQGSARWKRLYEGVMPALQKAAEKNQRTAKKYLTRAQCEGCDGTRLHRAARAVRLDGHGLGEFIQLSISDLAVQLKELQLTQRQATIARDLLQEIQRRLSFLEHVGLSYLTLGRSADTLSGGEAQRIRLAAQLGSALQGVLYVLDEPSIGLHARDHGRLLEALKALRDGGNTVVVVEHDEATLRAADLLVDVGPGPGRHGGQISGIGTPEEVAKVDSPTGKLLRGELHMPAPPERRTGNGNTITIRKAAAFNLRSVDVSFPLGTLTALVGVSGSGKSTLLNRILLPALQQHLGLEAPDPLQHESIEGLDVVEDLVCIDAKPIGRTPRSNPATYTKTFDNIRELFATLPEARMRGWTKSRFSFNMAGGRCEACGGAGAILVELQFLSPVTVPCDECGGRRFNAETLNIEFKGKNIADVLDLAVEDALEFFVDHPKISRALEVMVEVGLGYLSLGQPSTTLSGGEAQRMKLASYLRKNPRGHTLFLLDEPTTGLHQQDVQRLVHALQELVNRGHSVIVIEHNLDVVRASDYAIELGPEGGSEGGRLIASGVPELLEQTSDSPTGKALLELGGVRDEAETQKSKRSKKSKSKSTSIEITPPPTHMRVRGARTHNLQNVDVEIPRDRLTVVTGPSGSGKSSLALDTLFTEGRRRFVESLSTYARQFLGNRDRPPVDGIEGLGPSVAVSGGSLGSHPRSTVATSTEILDHLRVLWARAGTPRCPKHGEALQAQSPSRIAKGMAKDYDGQSGWLVAPVLAPQLQPCDPQGMTPLLEQWRKQGFLRILINQVEVRLDQELDPELKLDENTRVDLVIDRVSFKEDARGRLAEGIEQAEALADGRVSCVLKSGERHEFSTRGACSQCGFALREPLEPRHFSFNTHSGACSDCGGLGERLSCAPELLLDDAKKSLLDGAIEGKLGRYLTKGKGYYEHLLRTVASSHKIDLERPFYRLTDKQQQLLLRGTGSRESYRVTIEKSYQRAEIEERFTADWPGLCGHVDAWHAKTDDPGWANLLEQAMRRQVCATCEGERLRSDARAVTLSRKRLPEMLEFSVERGLEWLKQLRVRANLQEAVQPVLAELLSRLSLLERVGLGYLTLNRASSTLSGGEARRVRLAASLGSQLVGVCYVLDEPTVGLHPADVSRLTDALCELRDAGNSVVVVEHDESLMRRSDWIVDLGPGAGQYGGRIMASGTPEQLATGKPKKGSQTSALLQGAFRLKRTRPEGNHSEDSLHIERTVGLRGARLNNLKGVDFEAHFGHLTGVCGPSGSGKSTMIMDVLAPALKGEANGGRWERVVQPAGGAVRTVVVDASPIGRTPSSVPATYTGLMVGLRELYARTPEARMLGYGPAHFSFNSSRGRCSNCEGRGASLVEMQFLADLWLTCEECDGSRYRPEVLEVRYRNKSIADVLKLSVLEAIEFLASHPKLLGSLETLRDVGLGYLALGQSSTTLSAGEAQRVKLASELQVGSTQGPSVLILDEPSTGLHACDVANLAAVLERLADLGHAVIVIEHHTGLLNLCDRLVELGPAGGEGGGQVIATGTPEELQANAESVTGPWLTKEAELPRAPRTTQASKTTRKKATKKVAKKTAKKATKKKASKAGTTRKKTKARGGAKLA